MSAALLATFWMLANPVCGIIVLFYALYGSNRYSRLFAVPVGLLFASIGYNIYPNINYYIPDLMRYFQIVRDMERLTFSAVLRQNRDMLYIRDALFYIVSQTSDEHILPFVIGLLTYATVFYVYFDYIARRQYYNTWKRNGKLYAVMTILAAIGIQPLFSVISNVRCVTSYVVITYAIYRELVQGKRNVITYVCYVVPCFLHTSALAAVGLRLALIPFSRAGRIKYIYCFLIVGLFPVAFHLGSQFLLNIPIDFIQSFVRRAIFYMEWTSGGWADKARQGSMYWIERIYGTPFLLFSVFYYFQSTKRNLTERFRLSAVTIERLSLFREFLFLVAVTSLCCLWITVGAFWRFEALFCLYSPVIFLACVQRQLEKRGHVSIALQGLLFSGVLMFLFSCALFIIRRVHMDLFFKGFVTTCPALLLFKLAKAIIGVLF